MVKWFDKYRGDLFRWAVWAIGLLSFLLNSSYNELKIDIYRKKICIIQPFFCWFTLDWPQIFVVWWIWMLFCCLSKFKTSDYNFQSPLPVLYGNRHRSQHLLSFWLRQYPHRKPRNRAQFRVRWDSLRVRSVIRRLSNYICQFYDFLVSFVTIKTLKTTRLCLV